MYLNTLVFKKYGKKYGNLTVYFQVMALDRSCLYTVLQRLGS